MAPEKNKTIEAQVEEVLAKIRPYIQMHRGDVELLKVEDDGTAVLHISGACADCSMADLTYNKLIGGLLVAEVPGITNIRLETN